MKNPFQTYLDELNHAYESIHTAKEDAFWTAMMGLSDDAEAAQKELDRHDVEIGRFLKDPVRLADVRERLAAAEAARDAGADEAPSDEDLVELRGWVATFEANVIDSADGRALSEEIVADEGDLAVARGRMELGYRDPKEGFVRASSVKLGVMLQSEPEEALRKAAWEGLRSIEQHVLDHGFLDIVQKRNRLGRSMGAEDYYDWKVKSSEGMSKREVFALLDELEERTRDSFRRSLDALSAEHGPGALLPWNRRFHGAGDATREEDPYLPFARSVERWGTTFSALGIEYNGAELVLDLVDRQGKHENGFMHGPVPAWRDNGSLRPARIQFTANAIPGMIGSGARATRTLFHEGGHAAHFANMDMPSPCFSQEFAPTSVAFAETQSMFLDSLLGDADWRHRYALDANGEPMPWDLMDRVLRAFQAMAPMGVRGMLAVCYGEKAIYELPEDELTEERVLEVLRDAERRLLMTDEGATRPVLSVPHLISGDASAYYHGYVLAEMAVHQTRSFFLARDGHLVDNPRIGPDLRAVYWRPGNSERFGTLVQRLTNEPLTPAHLADHVNRTPDEASAQAKASLERLATVPVPEPSMALGARIRIAHGAETVAELDPEGAGFEAFRARFAAWIDDLAAVSS